MYVSTDTLPNQATSRDAHAIRGRLRTLPQRKSSAAMTIKATTHTHTCECSFLVISDEGVIMWFFLVLKKNGNRKANRRRRLNKSILLSLEAVTNTWTCDGNNRNHVVKKHSRRRMPKPRARYKRPSLELYYSKY